MIGEVGKISCERRAKLNLSSVWSRYLTEARTTGKRSRLRELPALLGARALKLPPGGDRIVMENFYQYAERCFREMRTASGNDERLSSPARSWRQP